MRLFFILIILVRNSEPQLQNYVRTPQPLTPAPPPNQTFIPIRPAPSFAQQLTPPSEQQLTPAQFFTPPTLPPPLGQPLNEFIQQPPNQQCYLRKCDQIISGRNLLYARALEIVQNVSFAMNGVVYYSRNLSHANQKHVSTQTFHYLEIMYFYVMSF